MIFKLLRYLKGYVRVKILGNSVERFINICRMQNIQLWELVSNKHSYEMCMSIHDFRLLRQIRRKTGIHIEIQHKYGFPFLIHSYSNRYFFILGFFLFCCTIFYCCNTIWSIRFSGNQFYTQETLNEYLCQNNIRIGMSKNKLECEKIVQLLRTRYHEIVWVSASIDGTCLQIQIKENTQLEQGKKRNNVDSDIPTDMIALKSGRIHNLVTREGIPLIHEGDSVSIGQILISGIVPIRNDSEETIAYKHVISDADIYAETEYYYKDIIMHSYPSKKYKKKRSFTFYVQYNHMVFILHPVSQKKNEETHVYHHSFYLLRKLGISASCGIKQTIPYKQISKKYTRRQEQQILSNHFQLFCDNLEKKGVQITSNSVKINIGVSASKAEGIIRTIEKIGVSKPSQIPENQEERISTE